MEKILIQQHEVELPYKPYHTQVAIISRVLTSVSKSQNALIESATGTGKSIALLCGALAAQRKLRLAAEASEERERTEAMREEEALPVREMRRDSDPTVMAATTAKVEPTTEDLLTLSTLHDSQCDRDSYDDDFVEPEWRPTKPRKRDGSKGRIDSADDDGSQLRNPKSPPRTTSDVAPAAAGIVDDPDGPVPVASVELSAITKKRKRAEAVPRVFYGTRTHSQVAQIIGEVRKTAYRPRTCVLASREFYCINPSVRNRRDREAECKSLVTQAMCRYHTGSDRLAGRRDLKNKVWDVEDIVAMGKQVGGCPYYASKTILQDAELVVCPYNYVLDWKVRGSLGLRLDGAVVIVDEAHNVSDALMDAASAEVDISALKEAVPCLKQVAELDAELSERAARLNRAVGAVIAWAADATSTLRQTDFEKMANVWSGAEAAAILDGCGISAVSISDLVTDLAMISDRQPSGDAALSDKNPPERKQQANGRQRGKQQSQTATMLSARATFAIESILNGATMLLSEGMKFVSDFRLVLERLAKKRSDDDSSDGFGGGDVPGLQHQELGTVVRLWCLSPAAAFCSIDQKARSVILASGTLAPFEILARELRADFPLRAELGHVVDPCQVFSCVVGEFEVTYRTSEEYSLQDAVGRSLVSCCTSIPSGVLCFFPSYSLLSRMVQRWRSTGAMRDLCDAKGGNVFSEDQLREAKATTAAGKRSSSSLASSVSPREAFAKMLADFKSASRTPSGALLLAVCRGKASEGLDFSDDAARGVVVVGIPYPSTRDLHVGLKREHEEKVSRGSGVAWYLAQGHRATNQAIGRVVRHRWDYGCVVLLDSRYGRPDTASQLSKWVRSSLEAGTVEDAVPQLRQFFENASRHVAEHRPVMQKQKQQEQQHQPNGDAAVSAPPFAANAVAASPAATLLNRKLPF